jgi:hypothetical protein
MKLGAEHDLLPFVFSRPPLFEEISWSGLPGNDFSPTFAMTIGAGDGAFRCRARQQAVCWDVR